MDEENRQGKVLLVLNSKSVCLRFSGYMAGRSFPRTSCPQALLFERKDTSGQTNKPSTLACCVS